MAMTDKQIAYQMAHIHEDKGPNTIGAVSVFFALAALAILLRIHVRWNIRAGFGPDEYTIFAAGVSVPTCVLKP